MNPVFSIIIPHRNIPDLLTRCLDSIPRRDDIQVIVVDDNSDPKIVDFGRFPGLGCPNVEVYFDKTGLGAGHARNVGLDHAKGEWLIFSDADDFFSDLCNELLEKYKDASEDVIYFNTKAVMSDDITKPSGRSGYTEISQYLDNLQKGHEIVRSIHVVPWAKMIRKKLVDDNNFRYQEIPWSNDTFFAVNVGVSAHEVLLEKEVLYIVTEREGSLMGVKEKSVEEIRCRAKSGIETYKVALSHGFKEAFCICNGWIIELFNKDQILLFFRAVKMLGYEEEKKVHGQLARNRGLLYRIYLKVLFVLFKYIPMPSL